ncbi:hypothetical protein L195_g058286 [Trifolium pratense]|uniref:Uncharacterized protein n=1 Tax=Trifolium pratense TaxID=57577 RepID=A0A2K3JRC4_TRIPR|nr:hypothetical protein L195_g058286 [Trifolium pratense]
MAGENNSVLRNSEPEIPLGMPQYEGDSRDGVTTTASEDDPTYETYILEHLSNDPPV